MFTVRYLIFGGTGSLGKKLIEKLLPTNYVFVYSRDEAKHWSIRNELSDNPRASALKFFVGDIRDKNRISDVLRQCRPNVVIIAAALKQVDTCEYSPSESVLTNIIGTQNVITALNEYNSIKTVSTVCSKILFVSTDKACAPVNIYGMCKAISERLVTSQSMTGNKHVEYLATRYGNVLESRGSIIPLFKYQAEHSNYFTVTDPNMTRFVMTLDDSVALIMHALEHGHEGETWIPKLPAMKIGDLAELFAEKYNKSIKIIGLRPGEKIHEELINESESSRTELRGSYYAIAPAYVAGKNAMFKYTSNDNVMSKEQLNAHLTKLGIFSTPLASFTGLHIEEIMTNRK